MLNDRKRHAEALGYSCDVLTAREHRFETTVWNQSCHAASIRLFFLSVAVGAMSFGFFHVHAHGVKRMPKPNVIELFHEIHPHSFQWVAVIEYYSIVAIFVFVSKRAELSRHIPEVNDVLEGDIRDVL